MKISMNGALCVLSEYFESEVPHGRMTFWLHKGYFSFCPNRVGTGCRREFTGQQLIAIVLILRVKDHTGWDFIDAEIGQEFYELAGKLETRDMWIIVDDFLDLYLFTSLDKLSTTIPYIHNSGILLPAGRIAREIRSLIAHL